MHSKSLVHRRFHRQVNSAPKCFSQQLLWDVKFPLEHHWWAKRDFANHYLWIKNLPTTLRVFPGFELESLCGEQIWCQVQVNNLKKKKELLIPWGSWSLINFLHMAELFLHSLMLPCPLPPSPITPQKWFLQIFLAFSPLQNTSFLWNPFGNIDLCLFYTPLAVDQWSKGYLEALSRLQKNCRE